MVVIRPMGKTSDKITGKAENEIRQVRTHISTPDTSPKLKSPQDLSIRVNLKVTEEVVHHAGLWVDGGLHLHLYVCKIIHPSLESSDPFHHVLSLVNPITDIPLQRSVPVKVPGRGGGFGSEARLEVPLRGVIITTLVVTRVATPIPNVPLGLLRVSLRCSRSLLCCLHASSPHECKVVLWSCGTPLSSDQTAV
jgi:hypothetical protein